MKALICLLCFQIVKCSFFDAPKKLLGQLDWPPFNNNKFHVRNYYGKFIAITRDGDKRYDDGHCEFNGMEKFYMKTEIDRSTYQKAAGKKKLFMVVPRP